MPVEHYHYHHNIKPKFFKLREEKNVPFLGVELEIDKSPERNENEVSEKLAEIIGANFMYYETDGSLEHGFECITQPATLGYHCKKLKNYQNAFKFLVSNNYRSHNTNSCGLHIHVNRSYFNDVNSYLFMLKVFDKFWDDLKIYSRRSEDELSRWASKYEESPEQIIDSGGDIFDRYKCINFLNSDTIEFRIFKGTLNPNSYFSCLKLINNICIAANQFSNKDIRFEDVKFEDFLTDDSMVDYWKHAKNLNDRHNNNI